MTIRSKVEEESPDGRVLFIEDLRSCLGIGTSDCDAPAAGKASPSVDPTKSLAEVLLIGHDLRGDFPKMRAEGIDFDPHLYYFGCLDTYVVVEDTCNEQLGKSLSRLMAHYGLANGRTVRPKNLPASKAKFVFFGAHNAGNDAIASLKVAIAQALDSEIRTWYRGESEDQDESNEEILNRPLRGMKKNMVLLAYDAEGVESNRYDRQRRPIGPATTEHGFAWLSLAEVADVPPGMNGVNWHPHIQARHWLNWEYRNFTNFKYVVGNPLGFWKEFGETQYYFDSEGPVPFHQLFLDISRAIVVKERSGSVHDGVGKSIATVEEITSIVGKTTLGDKPSDFRGNMGDTRGNKSTSGGDETVVGAKMATIRGNRSELNNSVTLKRSKKTIDKGYGPAIGPNVPPSKENATTYKGNGPGFGDTVSLSGGHAATYKRNKPAYDHSGSLVGVKKVTTMKGSGPNLSDEVVLSRARAGKNKGNGPTWAQIARGTRPK